MNYKQLLSSTIYDLISKGYCYVDSDGVVRSSETQFLDNVDVNGYPLSKEVICDGNVQ